MRLSLDELTEMARKCRKDIVRMTNAAGSGHPGGSLSAIDLMVALYGTNLSFRVDEPEWEDRDRFILSKGHASPAMYAVLHQMGIDHQRLSVKFMGLDVRLTGVLESNIIKAILS